MWFSAQTQEITVGVFKCSHSTELQLMCTVSSFPICLMVLLSCPAPSSFCNSSVEGSLPGTVLFSSSQVQSTERGIKHIITTQIFSLSTFSCRLGTNVYLNGGKCQQLPCLKHGSQLQTWGTIWAENTEYRVSILKALKTKESFGTIVIQCQPLIYNSQQVQYSYFSGTRSNSISICMLSCIFYEI